MRRSSLCPDERDPPCGGFSSFCSVLSVCSMPSSSQESPSEAFRAPPELVISHCHIRSLLLSRPAAGLFGLGKVPNGACVLVLEAGEEDTVDLSLPGRYLGESFRDRYVFRTVPRNDAQFPSQPLYLTRNRVHIVRQSPIANALEAIAKHLIRINSPRKQARDHRGEKNPSLLILDQELHRILDLIALRLLIIGVASGVKM